LAVKGVEAVAGARAAGRKALAVKGVEAQAVRGLPVAAAVNVLPVAAPTGDPNTSGQPVAGVAGLLGSRVVARAVPP
jgi:hypothetical protein